MNQDSDTSYADLKSKLFILRFQLEFAKTSEEIVELKDEIKKVKIEMAKVLVKEKQEKEKGRKI